MGWSIPYDDKLHTTWKGKVVYPRKKNFKWSPKSIDKILTNFNNRTDLDEARVEATAIKIRSMFVVCQSLYSMVDDMFDIPAGFTYDEYKTVKDLWREANDEIIEGIARTIAEKSGVEELEPFLEIVGKLINRGMEYIITGDTTF